MTRRALPPGSTIDTPARARHPRRRSSKAPQRDSIVDVARTLIVTIVRPSARCPIRKKLEHAFTTLRAAARLLDPREARNAALASLDALETQWTALAGVRGSKRERVPCVGCGKLLTVPRAPAASAERSIARALACVTRASETLARVTATPRIPTNALELITPAQRALVLVWAEQNRRARNGR